jgi:hypothetical protein
LNLKYIYIYELPAMIVTLFCNFLFHLHSITNFILVYKLESRLRFDLQCFYHDKTL